MTSQGATPKAAVGETRWGSIKDVVEGPLINVAADDHWLSIVAMWLFALINLVQAIFGGLVKEIFYLFTVGVWWIPLSETYGSTYGSVMQGRPWWMAWTWWRWGPSATLALIARGSRLALFTWEWEAFGKDRYWFHGEGFWCWSYADCQSILKADQARKAAFGAVRACIPDLFPTKLLIFLPSGADTEWAAIRGLVHEIFLNSGADAYRERLVQLPEKLAGEWSAPKLADFNDLLKVQKVVSKCIFFMMFEQWITDEEAKILTGWRTNAQFWILPRLAHRFLFNFGIGKSKSLRIATVGMIEKYNLKEVFVGMNDRLPSAYKRADVVQLCDEIMFGIGFAGIGGTCAAVESVGAFLQRKFPKESISDHIKWGDFDSSEKMVAKYRENPETYIRETLRMDPPVTSATSSFVEDTKVSISGREFKAPAGMFKQYALSMANRDPSVFPDPDIFNPDRANINQALTWNGAFGADDEASYPRICPGRYLSMDLTKIIVNHVVEAASV